MRKEQLLLKYKNNYICEQLHGEIDFIHLPHYFYTSSSISNYENISIFITLLLSGNINDNYESIHSYNDLEWSSIFEEYFVPECLYPVDEDVYLYDIDEMLEDSLMNLQKFSKTLEKLPGKLVYKSFLQLRQLQQEMILSSKMETIDEEEKHDFNFRSKVNLDLLNVVGQFYQKRTDKDVLLLYSGGRDSTLSAVRLKKYGYHVHFVHFNNGMMLDIDKPYLTYKKIFSMDPSFSFFYQFSGVDVKNLFQEYYFPWVEENGDTLSNGSLTSEIRCLSCRLAMYTKAFEIALQGNFKILAEGARISQKFMIEQIPMIQRLKELAREFGMEILFPVLDLKDDQKEIEELIQSGYSSKTWESKCFIGRKPKEKTLMDEETILEYYDTIIKPKILKKVKKEEYGR